jgi:predicted nuclease of predicted toxin-antitoxin system
MASAIKLYLDEQVDPDVAKGLRRHGIDVLTTQEERMLGKSDEQQLEYAISLGRTIFTQDDDFLRLAAARISHAGIVYVHQGASIGDIIEGLRLIVGVMTPEEMIDHIEYL